VDRVAQAVRPADVLRVSMQTSGAAQPAKTSTPPAGRPAIKPFDHSGVFLFTPAPAYRVHFTASIGRPDWPEYPTAGADVDYYLPTVPSDLKLEILDAAGKVVREYSNTARGNAPGGRGGGRRGGNLPTTLPTKIGMNRFVWDLRYAGGPAGGGDGEGGGFSGGGPLAAPGTYRARLTSNGVAKTESFTVKIDPRIAKDGITVTDLVELTKFQLKVRDSLADTRALVAKVRTAMNAKKGDAALEALWNRLVTKPGPYEDQMFVDQLSNVAREVGQADQKVGASASERYNELMKEWASIKADAAKAGI